MILFNSPDLFLRIRILIGAEGSPFPFIDFKRRQRPYGNMVAGSEFLEKCGPGKYLLLIRHPEHTTDLHTFNPKP